MWFNFKKATKTKVVETGRVCTCCWVKKIWKDFSVDKHSKTWYTSNCKECRNKYKIAYRNEEIRKKECEYKRQRRNTEVWMLKKELDNLYYPATRQNRFIIWKRNRKEALKTKLQWLYFYKWYDYKLLQKAYWEFKLDFIRA